MVSSIDSGRMSSIALARTASPYELQHTRDGGTSVVQRALRGESDAVRNHHLPDHLKGSENISHLRARPVDELSGRTPTITIKKKATSEPDDWDTADSWFDVRSND
jgi:hypothetical protein